MAAAMDDTARLVLDFYRALPFNHPGSAEAQAAAVAACDPFGMYPPLGHLCQRGVRVLEVGCGTGWLSQTLALRRGCLVGAIDFNPVAIERCRESATLTGADVTFETADLFSYNPERSFDLVLSIGVLHHTSDCLGAVRRLSREFVRPGGHVFIGLYHLFGRRPFLNHFRALSASGASEEALRAEFAALHAGVSDDPVMLDSWFRDQVLHPHETAHTLAELLPVLADVGMQLTATSLNDYRPFASTADLLELEPELERIGEKRLHDRTYFPGFFTVLARRAQ